MISIWLILVFALLPYINSNNITIRIYSNLAEIIRPFDKLPLEFSEDDWNNIQSDSITLIGKNVNISSQTITETKKSLNGSEIYIRSPITSNKPTHKLIKGILVDDINHLVKIQDESIVDHQPLYLTVPNDQILYVEKPMKPKYSVNFSYTSALDSQIFVSYLQSNINWRIQYQLNLHDNTSNLIAIANIRNDGKLPITVDQAELIGEDINLRIQKQQQNDRTLRKIRFGSESSSQAKSNPMQILFADSVEPIVEQGNEFIGLYVFSINKSFTIDAKTNYLLPMFHPDASVEQYGLISKTFSTRSSYGKAQRSYRLKSDRYLSRGNCIIREQNRVIGEIVLPNLASKDKHEFSIGEDANIIYKENVTLISNQTSSDKRRSSSIYEVHVQIKNFKDNSINIQYEQKGFYIHHSFKLMKSTKHQFIQDGSSIKSNMTLKANMDEVYSYTVEIIN